MTRELHLYGRRGCHLCAEMKDALEPFTAEIHLLEFDVDSDPSLVRQYGARVPVLTDGDRNEICHYFLDATALRDHLDTA